MKARPELAIEKAFDITYQLVIGEISIEMLVKNNPTVSLLYDPFYLTKKDFVTVIKWLMEHYVETEDYLRCAKLRDILLDKKSHSSIIQEIVLDDTSDEIEFYPGPETKPKKTKKPKQYAPTKHQKGILDLLITTLKSMDNAAIQNGFKDFIKKSQPSDIANSEVWSIMSEDDKAIFKGSFVKFNTWASNLSSKLRDEYIDRLLDDKSLIPTDEETLQDYISNQTYKYEELVDNLEDLDYANNIVVSFLDDYTIMSHTNLDKLLTIKARLAKVGILIAELRRKGDLHSLVYHSSQIPKKPKK